MFGFLNVYKPSGITSHDVISKLRRATKIKQIGHTGTLDPLAEGVLPVAVGKASRLIEYLKEDKAYITDLKFGVVSDTLDTEGTITEYSEKFITKENLLSALEKFKGIIEQIPPAYSAVHYNGKRLYELARAGIIPDDIPKRTVEITKLELLDFDYEKRTAKLEIACSKGTYIRSIISDLGQDLEIGAIMTALVRTKSGEFSIKNAIKLDELQNKEVVEKHLLPPTEVLSFAKHKINEEEYKRISNGQSLQTNLFKQFELVSIVHDNKMCAISQKGENNLLITKKVFI